MTFVSEQLKEHNVELTVVSYCFLILLIPLFWLIPVGINAVYLSMIDIGYLSDAVFDSWNMYFMTRAINVAFYFTVALGVWFLANVTQMTYLSYRQILYGE